MQEQAQPQPNGDAIPAANHWEKFLLPLALLLGLAIRLYQASTTYLNPDECWILEIARRGNWAESLRLEHHPILSFLPLYYLQALSTSELLLRLPALLSGWLFPWVLMRWLNLLKCPTAAWAAFLLLEFSPNLIALSTQLRGYTQAILLTALALYWLESALQQRSFPRLAFFALSLYLAILTEFSVAFSVAGLGIYALLRLLSQSSNWRFPLAWAATQLGALGVYGWLYQTQLAYSLANKGNKNLVEQYVSLCFPQPGQSNIDFAIQSTLSQFHYLASSTPMGILLFVLFLLGLCIIGRPWLPNSNGLKLWPLALTVLAVFAAALTASLLKFHPYGPTRHSILLCLFTTIPVALACQWIFDQWISDRLPRFRPLALPALAFGTLLLFVLAVPDPQNIPSRRHSLQSMRQAVLAIGEDIPQGSIILMDEETAWLLDTYLTRKTDLQPPQGAPNLHRYRFGSYRAYVLHWFFDSFHTVTQDLATLRRLENIPPTQPIYVLDSGFVQLPPAIWNARELSASMLLLLPE